MYRPNSTWTWAFFAVTLGQGIIALALEGWIFAVFQTSLDYSKIKPDDTQPRTIPTYLSLLIFGFIYQLILVYDALHNKNTIQVIGLVLYNLGILVYTAIQTDQVKDAVFELGAKTSVDFQTQLKPFLIAVPVVLGVGTIALAFVAWKLYDEFAWTIYKQISADLRLKRRYLIYQIYIALLKFDFFLFLGFTVQFLVIVQKTKGVEQKLTIIAIPFTVVLLLLAAYWTKKENVVGSMCIIVCYFVYLAYFLFKLVRMYSANIQRQQDYAPAKKTLTTFAVITILLLVITIAVGCWCLYNFKKGLAPHINGRRRQSSEDEQKEYGLQDIEGGNPGAGNPVPSRMTID